MPLLLCTPVPRLNLPYFPVLNNFLDKLTFLFSCHTILGPGKNNLATCSRKYLLLEDKTWINQKRLIFKINSLVIRTSFKILPTVLTSPNLLYHKSAKSQLICLLARPPLKSVHEPYKYLSLTPSLSAQTLLRFYQSDSFLYHNLTFSLAGFSFVSPTCSSGGLLSIQK